MTEHLDVLIVGAGISGIGVAYYLQHDQPQRTYAILEGRDAIGGTWDLFRYPGIRSDSDLYTFGFEFRPWLAEKSIADGPSILQYLTDTAAEFGIDQHIRVQHRVASASWSSVDNHWTVEVHRTDTGEQLTFTCGWLFAAGGYYRYDEAYTPHFDGTERFRGPIIHPQFWPDDLDYAGKRVLVIGSGATAVTLVPAMAESAAHVTMLQRTPTYVLPVPSTDRLALALRKRLGPDRAYPIVRAKNIAQQRATWLFAQKQPALARKAIRWVNTRSLPEGYPVDEHFNPPYGPWDQRLCAVPDGDLFRAISKGAASVVTGRIATFTQTGVQLESGDHIDADIIVTATGLSVQAFGGVPLTVDGEPVTLADTIAYKGLMLSGVPNLAYAIGYTNSSWTLKIGLLAEYLCRLLTWMDTFGYEVCVPVPSNPDMPTRPFLDFGAGYIQRAVDVLPRQGDHWPWLTSMGYRDDAKRLRGDHVEGPELHFSTSRHATGTTAS